MSTMPQRLPEGYDLQSCPEIDFQTMLRQMVLDIRWDCGGKFDFAVTGVLTKAGYLEYLVWPVERPAQITRFYASIHSPYTLTYHEWHPVYELTQKNLAKRITLWMEHTRQDNESIARKQRERAAHVSDERALREAAHWLQCQGTVSYRYRMGSTDDDLLVRYMGMNGCAAELRGSIRSILEQVIVLDRLWHPKPKTSPSPSTPATALILPPSPASNAATAARLLPAPSAPGTPNVNSATT